MAVSFELAATPRVQHGKAVSRRERRLEKRVPAIVYGGKEAPVSVSLEANFVNQALQNEAFFSHILTLNIDKTPEKVVLKAIQRHPYKPVIMHMDFLRVNAKEKLYIRIPLHFLNEDKAPGVKNEGGVLSHNMSDVEVACLPANLPEFIEVDLANLGMHESVHLSALKLPKGVEIVALTGEEPSDAVIAHIHEPKVQEEPETPETEITGESAEGEEGASEEAANAEGAKTEENAAPTDKKEEK